MSGSKDIFADSEHATGLATRVAVAAGVLKKCPYHDVVFNDSVLEPDYRKAYAYGNKMINDNEITLGETVSKGKFSATIKKVIDQSAIDCWQCAKFDAE
jgi:hypothetical protein